MQNGIFHSYCINMHVMIHQKENSLIVRDISGPDYLFDFVYDIDFKNVPLILRVMKISCYQLKY